LQKSIESKYRYQPFVRNKEKASFMSPSISTENNHLEEASANGNEVSVNVEEDSCRLQEPDVHNALLDDIERLIEVLPLKTRAQDHLDICKTKLHRLQEKYRYDFKYMSSLEIQLKHYQESNKELINENLDAQWGYSKEIAKMRKEYEKKVKEVAELEREKVKKEIKTATRESVYTMTTVDMYTEQKMKVNEFNNIVAKYRSKCRATKLKGVVNIESSSIVQDSLPAIENQLNPIYGILQVVKSGKSKYREDVKSVKNVLKMIAGLIQAKIAAMDPKLPGKNEIEA
jgi:hypothetical protein